MNQAEKTAAKVSLVEHGLWRAFHRTRDRYKAAGQLPADAYDLAHADFFPSGPSSPPALPKECPDEATEPGAVGNHATAGPSSPISPGVGGGVTPSMSPDALALVPAATFVGRTASRAEVVDWVAENVAVESVDPATCPSAEAWAMLRWVRRSLSNETDFWKTIYRALLPARSELDATARFADDGRNVLRVISMMEKANPPAPDDVEQA